MQPSIRTKLLRVENRKFVVHIGDDIVPPSYRFRIKSLCLLFHKTLIPPDWDWRWKVNNGEYRGKMPRRLSKLCGCKLHELIVEILHNVREEMPSPLTHIIDVTFYIDWKDGAFGDAGSCYWNSARSKIIVMNRNGFGAVRKYVTPKNVTPGNIDVQTLDKVRGYGRAWLAPDVPEKGMLAIYNSYPPGLYVSEFADIFCKALPKMVEEEKTSFSHWAGQLRPTGNSNCYINGLCRVIGPEDKIKKYGQEIKKVKISLEHIDYGIFI